MSETKKQILEDIKKHRVILFMKGSKSMPLCGFSGKVVSILNKYETPYETRDILQDEMLRAEIKVISDWPTLPQLYIDQTFIGGCDIVCQLDESGELASLLQGVNA